MIYTEPDAAKFVAAIQRLKQRRQRREQLTKLAVQRIRAAIRKRKSV